MKTFFLSASVLALTSLSAFADNFDVTCQTLGSVGQCQNVTICRPISGGICRPNMGTPPRLFAVCDSGTTEQTCGWQSTFCHWEIANQCVPNR
jgi:hypothetical protein